MLTAPTTSGWSGFWNLQGDKAPFSMSQAQGRSKDAKHIARMMKGYNNRDVIGALAALIGAAPGGTATNQYTRERIPASGGPQGAVPVPTSIGDFSGNILIETVNAINRATTAADVTELKRWFNNALLEAGITYPNSANATGSTVMRGTMHANMPGFS